jgi:hypothetical protein
MYCYSLGISTILIRLKATLDEHVRPILEWALLGAADARQLQWSALDL